MMAEPYPYLCTVVLLLPLSRSTSSVFGSSTQVSGAGLPQRAGVITRKYWSCGLGPQAHKNPRGGGGMSLSGMDGKRGMKDISFHTRVVVQQGAA